jgi:hypothetical protein
MQRRGHPHAEVSQYCESQGRKKRQGADAGAIPSVHALGYFIKRVPRGIDAKIFSKNV